MAFLNSTFLIFRMHMGTFVRSKRALICALLALVPPAIAYVGANVENGPFPGELAFIISWLLCLQVVVPILSLIAGSAVVTEEVENRTVTYLFTRAIPRPALLLGRWLATFVLITGFVSLSSLGVTTFAAGATPAERHVGHAIKRLERSTREERAEAEAAGAAVRTKEEIREELRAEVFARDAASLDRLRTHLLWACILGGMAYSLIFAVMGVFIRHTMIVGLGYAFAVEGLLANLPGKTQSLSLVYYLRSIVADGTLRAQRDIYPYDLADLPTPWGASQTLLIIAGVALLLGCWSIARKQFVLTS